jgi:hypothetical protein
MALVAFDKVCPRCHGKNIRRIERKPWMRHLPKSKYYKCRKCQTGVLVIYDWLAFKVG